MRLTKAFEQGVCIMTILSTQVNDVPISTHIINQRLQGSATYIQKIIRKLVVAKLVISVSGNNGGFILAKDPKRISLLEIVEALEGKIDTYPSSGLFSEIFNDIQPAKKGDRIIHNKFKDADDEWKNSLRKISVHDIIRETLDFEVNHRIDWNNLV